MDFAVISTTGAPEAVGAYSQAVKAGGLVFCSGQIPLAPSGELVTGSIEVETKQCLDNLTAVLGEAGSGFERIVKVTAFLTDMSDFPEFNEAYSTYFGERPPARATVGVAALPKGARVEVECIALA